MAEALSIADERGLAAVSMRTVAERVGVSAMALYPHVAGKEALLDGLVDLLMAELLPMLDDAPDDWWGRLVALAQGVRTVARRHPGAFTLLFARPSVTPAAVRVTDAVMLAALDAGVPEREVPRVERMVSTFVIGFANSEANGRFSPGTLDPRARRMQLTEADVPAHYRLAPYLDRRVDWDAEFEADLADLRRLIESSRTNRIEERGDEDEAR